MTRCEPYRACLAALADGQAAELAPELRQDLDDHLRTCADCRRELAGQRQMVRLLEQAAPPMPSPDRWQLTWEAIDARTTRRRPLHPLVLPFGRWGRWAAAGSSVVAAGLILAIMLLGSPTGWRGGDVSAQPTQGYAFATGQDSDIQVLEMDAQDVAPVVVTSGTSDVVVVWMVQTPSEKSPT